MARNYVSNEELSGRKCYITWLGEKGDCCIDDFAIYSIEKQMHFDYFKQGFA